MLGQYAEKKRTSHLQMHKGGGLLVVVLVDVHPIVPGDEHSDDVDHVLVPREVPPGPVDPRAAVQQPVQELEDLLSVDEPGGERGLARLMADSPFSTPSGSPKALRCNSSKIVSTKLRRVMRRNSSPKEKLLQADRPLLLILELDMQALDNGHDPVQLLVLDVPGLQKR